MREAWREYVEDQLVEWTARWEQAEHHGDITHQMEAAKFLYHIHWLLGDEGVAQRWIRERKAHARAAHRRRVLAETLVDEATLFRSGADAESVRSALAALREARRIYEAERYGEGVDRVNAEIDRIESGGDAATDDHRSAKDYALRFLRPHLRSSHWTRSRH